jgi:hypothetical protein
LDGNITIIKENIMNYPLLKRNRYFDEESGFEYTSSARNHFQDFAHFHLPLVCLQQAYYVRGIARGLEVQGKPSDNFIMVTPGVALDGQGGLIVLPSNGSGCSWDPSTEKWTEIRVADTGLELQIAATWPRAEPLYLLIEWHELLRRNEGCGGRWEQVPKLYAVPTAELDQVEDLQKKVVLGIMTLDSEGKLATLVDHLDGCKYGRRLLGERLGSIELQRTVKASNDELIAETAGSIEPFDPANGNGLQIKTHALNLSGDLSVQGATELKGALSVSGAARLLSRLDVAGVLAVGGTAKVNSTLEVTGNVGIGTDTPRAKLHVRTDSPEEPTPTGPQFKVNDWADLSSISSGHGLFAGNAFLDDGDNSLYFSKTHKGIGAVGFAVNYPKWNQVGIFANPPSAEAGKKFQPNWVSVFQSDGKVGIGTITPKVRLQIDGGSNVMVNNEESGFLVIGSTTNTNLALASDEIAARNNGGRSPLYLQKQGGAVVVHSDPSLSSSRFVIAEDGKVSIGTQEAKGKLNVGGNTYLMGDAELTKTLTVGEDVTFKKGLSVEGATAMKGSLTVGGAAELTKTLTVGEAAIFKKGLSVEEAASMKGSLTVSGAAELKKTLTVGEAVTFKKGLSVEGATAMKGALSVTGNVGIRKMDPKYSLDVEGNVNFSGVLRRKEKDTLGNITGVIQVFFDNEDSKGTSWEKVRFGEKGTEVLRFHGRAWNEKKKDWRPTAVIFYK